MKDYNLQNYLDNFKGLVKDFASDLTEALDGHFVKGPTFGRAEITAVEASDTNLHIELVVDNGFKTFDLIRAFTSKNIEFEELEDGFLVSDYIVAYDEFVELRNDYLAKLNAERAIEAAKIEAEYQARVAAAKAKKEALEKAKKLQEKKTRLQSKFTTMLFEAKRQHLDINDEATVIGWLAKHTTGIVARMPDFLEAKFVSTFGEDAPRQITDSNKRTANGNPMQWAFSGHIYVDELETMPPVLAAKFNNKKVLNDSNFVLNLIYNYGFKFGKEQDVNEIKACFTATDLPNFELGYNS